MSVSPFVEHFGTLQDPRVDRTKLHGLLDLLVFALCAVIPRNSALSIRPVARHT